MVENRIKKNFFFKILLPFLIFIFTLFYYFYPSTLYAYCQKGDKVNLTNKYNFDTLRMVAHYNGDKIRVVPGTYEIIDIKGNFIKLKHTKYSTQGWVPDGWDLELVSGSSTLKEHCDTYNRTKVSNKNLKAGSTKQLNELETAIKQNEKKNISKKSNKSPLQLLNDAKNALAKLENITAINTLKQILEINSASDDTLVEVYYLLGRMYYIEGNYVEATKYTGLRHREFPKNNKYRIDNYYWLSKSLFALGDSDNGCLVLEDIIFSNTYKDSLDYINKAKLTSQDQNCGLSSDDLSSTYQVSNDLDKILENFDDDATTDLFNDAINDIKNDNHELAASKLKRVVESSSVDEKVLDRSLYTLGTYYFFQKDYIEAIKYYEIHKREFEDKQISGLYVNSYYKQGRSLFEIGDFENGCLIMEDLILNKKFKNETQFINEAKATSKSQYCNFAFDDDASTDSYQVSNDISSSNQSSLITASEIEALKQQLHSCLNLNVGVANLKDIKPVIYIEVNPDRTVKNAKVVNQERLIDPSFRTAAEAAMRAVNNPDCSPLILPPGKYDQWKEINFTFNFSWMFDQPDRSIKQKAKTLFVNASNLNVRSSPNGSEILGTLTINSTVQQIEITSNWTKVKDIKTGLEGWVSNKYLSDLPVKSSDETLIAQEESKPTKQITSPETNVIELDVVDKVNDVSPPVIQCNNNLFTQENSIEVNCSIQDDSDLYAILVDKEQITTSNNFSHQLQVPIGKSNVLVKAIDRFGNESDFVVSITRDFNLIINDEEVLEKLLPGSINARTNNNRIAIVIGIKDYKNIPDTKYADRDALTFIDYATDSLGIKPKNIQYLIDNKASILDLEELDQWLSKKIKRNTEVFFYYSGHGFNNNGESLLLPFDFRSNLVDRSSISKDSFIKSILSHNPEHIYAFFDACFSGLGREGETLIAGLRNISIAQEEKIDNVTIFNSASGAEFSSDYDEAGHGLFSYYLMKGLEGKADINEDQQISTSELYSYIEENVSSTALSIGFAQNPSLLSSQDKIILKW